ncbi:hypothetical protein EVA_08241 [gut metagenome]|uniref:Uncharacterized protein n=1 Tax=gut metagenome TaxID=749906 RepID=J9CTW1_9ZZZZ
MLAGVGVVHAPDLLTVREDGESASFALPAVALERPILVLVQGEEVLAVRVVIEPVHGSGLAARILGAGTRALAHDQLVVPLHELLVGRSHDAGDVGPCAGAAVDAVAGALGPVPAAGRVALQRLGVGAHVRLDDADVVKARVVV